MNAITGPTLLPFDNDRHCPACDHRPLPFPIRLFRPSSSHVNMRLCGGGKEPTEQCTHATPFGAQTHEFRNECAGVTASHLHVACNKCGHQWLTKTATEVTVYA